MTAQPTQPKAPIRHDWSLDEIEALFALPLLDLVHRAQTIHRQYHDNTVQLASLLSIKTGGCAEDCHYCPQSAHSRTTGLGQGNGSRRRLSAEPRQNGARGRRHPLLHGRRLALADGAEFDAMLDMVRGVRALGMEACVTLGMLQPHQARRLAEAGLTSYNHNLDTSPEFYGEIITTRTYQDRLDTLALVREENIGICCGGIIGMGETQFDRASLIANSRDGAPSRQRADQRAGAVRGTPLEGRPPVDAFELVRMIAVARITMPKARVRLSAGRSEINAEGQALCFMAGANSIFYGEKLLTTDNNDAAEDRALIEKLGLRPEEIQERSAHYDLDNNEQIAASA